MTITKYSIVLAGILILLQTHELGLHTLYLSSFLPDLSPLYFSVLLLPLLIPGFCLILLFILLIPIS